MSEAAATRILLVDDEAALREVLADYLVRQGFAVTQAGNAVEARARIAAEAFDLVLLDIMMPGEDGLSLCRHLAESRAVPVIFITAKGESTDRIVGLEIGGDDYVVKPFDPRELVARIRSVLRRSARQASEEWTLGALRLVPRRHEAWVGDEPLALSPREFRLLVELAREPGKVVAKNVLAQRLEPLGDALDAATLEVHVSNLRKKIGAERVVTVRGVGYRLQP